MNKLKTNESFALNGKLHGTRIASQRSYYARNEASSLPSISLTSPWTRRWAHAQGAPRGRCGRARGVGAAAPGAGCPPPPPLAPHAASAGTTRHSSTATGARSPAPGRPVPASRGGARSPRRAGRALPRGRVPKLSPGGYLMTVFLPSLP